LKAQREAWRTDSVAIDASRYVFVDETGTNTAMARRYGRAPRGQRIDGPVPHGHWKTVTLTAAVRLGGVGGCLAFDGATDAMTFETDVEQVLAPTLKPGDIGVMDNLKCHKGAAIERAITAVGAELRYLPAYSPDLNPIEKLFSKLKTLLRTAATRTVAALDEALGEALRAVTPQDIAGWFGSCGYSTPKREPL
jgi:transposase